MKTSQMMGWATRARIRMRWPTNRRISRQKTT